MRWEKLCEPKAMGGMGFKDLKAFNLALLAKQGWRLQQERPSLYYRVFKNKYFPNEDFIHAKKGHHPSFVGNGHSINMWKDKWTNNPTTFQIASPPKLIPMETMVSALIDANSGAWKANMVQDIFMEHEADSILSIPLSTKLPANRLV